MDGEQLNLKAKNLIDLFAGVGGISLGAARAGFRVALAAEWDVHAAAAHKLNFPKMTHWDGDIGLLDGSQLLTLAGLKPGELNGLVGGPPCQGFSTMGRRNTTDPRNNLFRHFFKLVSQTLPEFFVAENVMGILAPQYDEIREEAFSLVSATYNLAEPLTLKACDFGAPTSRERVFFIGVRKNLKKEFSYKDIEKSKVENHTLVRDALLGLPAIRSEWREEKDGWRAVSELPSSFYGVRIAGNIPDGVGDKESIDQYKSKRIVSGCLGTIHSEPVAKRYGSLKPGQQDSISKSVRLKPHGLCPTLRAGTNSDRGSYQAVRPIHPTSARVITPREAARLQGFPDWFRFAPSKWHSFRQIGNSVSPFVAEAVLKSVKNKLYHL